LRARFEAIGLRRAGAQRPGAAARSGLAGRAGWGWDMRRQRTPAGGGLSQRQLRVGERLRHVLADLFSRGAVHDPVIAETPLTISEVRVSRDLRQATVYLVELGGDLSKEVRDALARATPFLRGELARQSNLKYAPNLAFKADETFAESARIDALLEEARRARPAPTDDVDDEGVHG
jgi:ribosome-binding factor A